MNVAHQIWHLLRNVAFAKFPLKAECDIVFAFSWASEIKLELKCNLCIAGLIEATAILNIKRGLESRGKGNTLVFRNKQNMKYNFGSMFVCLDYFLRGKKRFPDKGIPSTIPELHLDPS